MRFLRPVAVIFAAIFIVALAWLTIAPPDLIRVGANYSAKMVCSNLVLAGRDPDEVLAVDVQAPGHPLLRLMRLSIDGDPSEGEVTVRAGLFGFIGRGRAVGTRDHGCTSLARGGNPRFDGNGRDVTVTQDRPALWPDGDRVAPMVEPELDAVLNDADLVGPGMRAVIVVKDGRIVAERYGEGFDPDTPLLGWSVTKTVTAALIGRAVREGALDLRDDITGLGWTDARDAISIPDLMGMASDLEWNEGYGSVSDVTRMLFLETDMAGFASAMALDDETPLGIGESFEYSSGTTVILSRIWQKMVGDEAAGDFPYTALFEPLGMTSAVMERDATGTFVGSSYMYATARDWARFGQFMLQRGVWEGRSLLPVGYADWMVERHPSSRDYGRGQIWLRPANAWMEGDNADLPPDAYFMNGHDGQSINVIPSEGIVVVRLGLTPSLQGYKVAHLIRAVIDALE